jgi:hypothetical protein
MYTTMKIVQALKKATAMGSVEAERGFYLMNNVCANEKSAILKH